MSPFSKTIVRGSEESKWVIDVPERRVNAFNFPPPLPTPPVGRGTDWLEERSQSDSCQVSRSRRRHAALSGAINSIDGRNRIDTNGTEARNAGRRGNRQSISIRIRARIWWVQLWCPLSCNRRTVAFASRYTRALKKRARDTLDSSRR